MFGAQMEAVIVILKRVMPSDMQIAEWEAKTGKGSFGRLSLALSPCSNQRLHLLECCIHRHNSRTRTIWLNHIRTMYASQYTESQPWIAFLQEEQGAVLLSYMMEKSAFFIASLTLFFVNKSESSAICCCIDYIVVVGQTRPSFTPSAMITSKSWLISFFLETTNIVIALTYFQSDLLVQTGR